MGPLNKTLTRFALACLVVVPACAAAAASAATWPTKPIRLIVPFSPGGGTDIIARALGQKLSETFGQQFIVDNRPGVNAFPGVPTIGEVVPGFAAEHWYGIWGTPGTPPEIIARVNQAVGRILQMPELRDPIIADGFVPAHSTPGEYRKRIARDVARWIEVVKRGNIRVDVIG